MSDFIHRFVAAKDKVKEVFLMLHGTGGDENDLLPLGLMLAQEQGEVALLSVRGKVLENGAARFFRRRAEGVFDEQDLIFRTHELADFIESAKGKLDFDDAKITAIGYSNGANIAASVLLLRPDVINRAVLFHAMTPLENDELPDLKGKQILVVAGRFDPIVPKENTRHLVEMFRGAGARVELYIHDGGHQLAAQEVERARVWLDGSRTTDDITNDS